MSHIAAFYERTKYWKLTKLDQRVSEKMLITGNKLKNFLRLVLFIILQNANMVANRKTNCVLTPSALAIRTICALIARAVLAIIRA